MASIAGAAWTAGVSKRASIGVWACVCCAAAGCGANYLPGVAVDYVGVDFVDVTPDSAAEWIKKNGLHGV